MNRLIYFIGFVALLWAVGLVAFVGHIETLQEPVISPDMKITDAIVVLTGGSERVTTGVSLLKAEKAKKLFISGVYPGAPIDRLLSGQNVPKSLRDCCITLGHAAESTVGNAEETDTWMAIENAHSMRLVTANYHMPRSLLVFSNVMPDMEIIPHPVMPESVKLDQWWMRPGTANLLVTEYNKYLGTVVKLWLEKIRA